MIEKEKVQHKKKEISIQAPVKAKRQHVTNSTVPVHDFKQRKSESATLARTTQTNDNTGKQPNGKVQYYSQEKFRYVISGRKKNKLVK